MKQDAISKGFGFRSKAAIRLTRISIGLSSLAALAVVPGWEQMFGCVGFLGLIGIATVAEFGARIRNQTMA